MVTIKTDWGPLLGFYLVVAGITLILGYIDRYLTFIWLGANLVFLGFIVWLERPFIPIVRRRAYLAILVSVGLIFLGLAVSVIPCLR